MVLNFKVDRKSKTCPENDGLGLQKLTLTRVRPKKSYYEIKHLAKV